MFLNLAHWLADVIALCSERGNSKKAVKNVFAGSLEVGLVLKYVEVIC